MVISDHLVCPLLFHSTDFGIVEDVDIVKISEDGDVISRHFNVQIGDFDDLEKIRMPQVSHDLRATDSHYQAMCDVYDRISASPWCNTRQMVEQVGQDYVISRKPNPAIFAGDTWSPQRARAELIDFLEPARGGCHIEFIMKDISTVRRHPRRLWDWAQTAMEVAQAQTP